MRPEDTPLQYTLADRDMISVTQHLCRTILDKLEEQGHQVKTMDARIGKLEKFQTKVVSISTFCGLIVGYAIHLFK